MTSLQECLNNATIGATAVPEPFVPPPSVSSFLIVSLGFALVPVLSSWIWPVLLVAIVLGIAAMAPYCFRTTDHAVERRRLYGEFVLRQDPLIQKVLAVPDYVNVEERYWINSR